MAKQIEKKIMRKGQQIDFDECEMGFDNLLYLFFDPKKWGGIYSGALNSIGLCVAHYASFGCVMEELLLILAHENLHKTLKTAIYDELGKEDTKNIRAVQECCVNSLMGFENSEICSVCGRPLYDIPCEFCERDEEEKQFFFLKNAKPQVAKKERETRMKKIHLDKLVVWGVLMADRRGRNG